MAYYNDAEDVKAIFTTDMTDPTVERFIRMANIMLTNVFTATDAMSDDEMEMLELLLACHFCCLNDPRQQSLGVGRANESRQGTTGMRLSASTYGQQAMAFDRTGKLTARDSANFQKASLDFAGSDVSDRLTGDTYNSDYGIPTI